MNPGAVMDWTCTMVNILSMQNTSQNGLKEKILTNTCIIGLVMRNLKKRKTNVLREAGITLALPFSMDIFTRTMYKCLYDRKEVGSMYYVHYCRLISSVTDMRIFNDLNELSEWFEAQNKLEPTVITKIERRP